MSKQLEKDLERIEAAAKSIGNKAISKSKATAGRIVASVATLMENIDKQIASDNKADKKK